MEEDITATVFDYDVTSEELNLLYIKSKNKEEYLRSVTPKKVLHDLYVLFRIREDYLRAGEIRKRIFEEVA